MNKLYLHELEGYEVIEDICLDDCFQDDYGYYFKTPEDYIWWRGYLASYSIAQDYFDEQMFDEMMVMI